VYGYFATQKEASRRLREVGTNYNAWARKILTRRKSSMTDWSRKVPTDLFSKIPDFPKDAEAGDAKSRREVCTHAQAMPLLMSGSAICTDRQ